MNTLVDLNKLARISPIFLSGQETFAFSSLNAHLLNYYHESIHDCKTVIFLSFFGFRGTLAESLGPLGSS